MFVKLFKSLVVVIAALTMFGCSTKKAHMHKAATEMHAGVSDLAKFYGEEVTPEQEKEWLAKKSVYFGFDKFDVNKEHEMQVLAHARKMLEQPNLKVKIEGNADERGGREYNIALGEKRAQAVAQILKWKGVAESRIAIVSYGKEKPVALGHDEECWRQNRRADIVYEN